MGTIQCEDPSLERCFKGHRDAATSVVWHASARQVISGGADGCVMVWHLAPRLRAFRFLGHTDAVLGVAFDPVHNLVASASRDRTVRLWRPSAEGRSTVLKAHSGAVRGVAFSQNGELLATASDDKSVKLWSAPQQRFHASLLGHTNWVRGVALAPDARLAASGGDDRSARVWDLEARECVHCFEELEGAGVNVVRFHPDGTCIATGGTDGAVKLWDLRSDRLVWDLQEGQLFYTLHGHEGPVLGAAFSHGGEHFASAGADQQVMVWRTNFDACLASAVEAVARRGPAGAGRPATAVRPQRGAPPHGRPGTAAQEQGVQPTLRDKTNNGGGAGKWGLLGAGGKVQGTARQAAQPAAAAPAGGRGGAAADGSHVVFQSPSFNAADVPEGVAATLQQIVGQLDMLTQTMAVMEERLTISEDRALRLERWAAELQGQQQQGGEPTGGSSRGLAQGAEQLPAAGWDVASAAR
eukprot:scaffold5.g976.t1